MEFEVTQEVQTIWQYTQNATFEAIATQDYTGNKGAGPLGVPPGAAFATYRAPDSVFKSVEDHFHTSLPGDRAHLLFQYATSTFQATTPNVSIISPFVGLVQPEDSGYMLLASNDYHDKPLIYSNYYGSIGTCFSSPLGKLERGVLECRVAWSSKTHATDVLRVLLTGDKAAILHGYKRMREVFSSPQLAPILVRELYPGTNVTSDADLMHAIAGASLSFHHPVCLFLSLHSFLS